MTETRTTTLQRSQFVNIIAWIFIAISGLGALIYLLAGAALTAFGDAPEFRKIMDEMSRQQPEANRWMFEYLEPLAWGIFALSLIYLIISIALLKRKNWARMAFIVLLALGGIYSVASIFIGGGTGQLPPEFAEGILAMFAKVLLVVSALFNLAFAALQFWIAWRLTKPEIVAEFQITSS